MGHGGSSMEIMPPSQTHKKSVQEAASRVDAKLREVMTAKPVKRKHKGPSPELLFLRNKVTILEKNLSALKRQQELTENEFKRSIARPDSAVEPSAHSSKVSHPSASHSTVISITVGPTIPQNVASTNRSTKEKKLYKCLKNGCSESFTNYTSLYRHTTKVHSPDKLHKCDNCGRAFDRRYRYQSHVDGKYCRSKNP